MNPIQKSPRARRWHKSHGRIVNDHYLSSLRVFTHEPLILFVGDPIASRGRLKADAEANGIPYRDEQGRYADFHALRYTWATFLQRNNIPQRYAMMLMRHSDIKLTSKVYTDESQLPVYDSIKGLPRLLGCTQIRAQISGANGQNVAQAGATVTRKTHSEVVENGAKKTIWFWVGEMRQVVCLKRERSLQIVLAAGRMNLAGCLIIMSTAARPPASRSAN